LERKRETPDFQHRNRYFDRRPRVVSILEPTFEVAKPKTLTITARAFNTLVKSDFYDTILGSYLFAKQQGFKFNLAYIPNNFKFATHELIDPKYMTALFELGRAQGRLVDGWEHLPPVSLRRTGVPFTVSRPLARAMLLPTANCQLPTANCQLPTD
jgi:hypothetical protein